MNLREDQSLAQGLLLQLFPRTARIGRLPVEHGANPPELET